MHRRASWDSAAADLERRLPALRYDQAVAGISRLIGMLGDGHSRLDQLKLASHTRPTLTPLPGPGFDARFPVQFAVFTDGLWIVGATAEHRDLLGTRVLSIDGQPVARVVAALAPLIPADNSMWTLHLLPVFLASPGYLSAAGVAREPGSPLRLTGTDGAGRRREATISAERSDSAAHWIPADVDVRAPLPLTRSLAGPFAFADIEDTSRTLFVRIREIADDPGKESLAQFVARLFSHVDSLGSRRLVIDLRGNGGGNNYLNQPIMHSLIQRPALDHTGRLFVIIDRGTFSAAVSLAADLERETHALFVGEPTGSAPNSPGDPAHVTLPASGLVVRISTVLWQGSDPRDPRPFIAPDLPASSRWSDWLAHRDPALDAIAAYRPPPAGAPDMPPNQHWGSQAKQEAAPLTIAW
ncbi:MAG: hypothetical protein E6K72_03215 [Candidatus Eisenbacteria bacterium]|uniref:Tail specific protease domain-containing protein n=1 Tax=Eiseniibacteriota bacterium TaxID=2212470 RepID=A0A538T2K0_UNCEI|nr:MAG: hypothetical protein E6K72_03215 [Candidatus Eisenbacteria bacterium]